MTQIEKLRSLARMIPLDCWSSAITEVADEMDWRPIETAPDGTFLVYIPDARTNKIQAARKRNGIFIIGNSFAFDMQEKPSHWTPEPPAPKGAK